MGKSFKYNIQLQNHLIFFYEKYNIFFQTIEKMDLNKALHFVTSIILKGYQSKQQKSRRSIQYFTCIIQNISYIS